MKTLLISFICLFLLASSFTIEDNIVSDNQ